MKLLLAVAAVIASTTLLAPTITSAHETQQLAVSFSGSAEGTQRA